ncbi:MAG: TadE family protein, partial [Sphingomonadaceae bacterium]
RARPADAVAALEFALALPVFVALVLGAADFALTAAKAREAEALVEQAAQAAIRASAELLPPLAAGRPGTGHVPGQGGYGSGGTEPPAPLPALSLARLVSLPPDARGTLSLFRGCTTALGVEATTASHCSNGAPAAAFAEIAISVEVSRLVNWPDVLFSPTVSARSVVRLD